MHDISSRAMTLIMNELRSPLEQLGLKESEVGPDFDLVGSGLLDSMSFLDLLGALEKEFGFDINLEGLDIESVTTLSGLIGAVVSSSERANG